MPWFHGLKIRHEQQKADYLKNKYILRKVPNISGIHKKKLVEKKQSQIAIIFQVYLN